jgi:hypothetical protein
MHINNDIVGTQHLRVSQYVAAHGPLHGKQADAWLLDKAVDVVNLMKENLNEICVAVSVCKCWPAEFSIPKGAQAL